MKRAFGGLALGAALSATIFMACGSASDADRALVEQAGPAAHDASATETGDDAAPEPHLGAFPCGATSCLVGEHACCDVGGAFACFSLEGGGCPVVDAGADADASAPSAFLCATYNNCPQGDDCCYVVDAGASCAASCPEGAYRLCQLGVDGCGSDEQCTTLTPAPLPKTGRCKSSD